jgi:hypothetical protein
VFVLTAVAAIFLALVGPQLTELPRTHTSDAVRIVIIVETVLQGVLAAAMLTAAGYCLAWRLRDMLELSQPGHWLLLAMAFATVANLVDRFTWRLQSGAVPIDQPFRDAVGFLLIALRAILRFAPWIFYLYVGIKKCTERRWKWVFYALSLTGLLRFLFSFVGSFLYQSGLTSFGILGFGYLFVLAPLLVVAYAFAADLWRRIPRDAIHWIGVGLYVARALVPLITMPVWWFFA